MSIERYVELYCDECLNAGPYITAATVAEAKAEARQKGWTLNHNGHFCHCNEQGWAGEMYRARRDDDLES